MRWIWISGPLIGGARRERERVRKGESVCVDPAKGGRSREEGAREG